MNPQSRPLRSSPARSPPPLESIHETEEENDPTSRIYSHELFESMKIENSTNPPDPPRIRRTRSPVFPKIEPETRKSDSTSSPSQVRSLIEESSASRSQRQNANSQIIHSAKMTPKVGGSPPSLKTSFLALVRKDLLFQNKPKTSGSSLGRRHSFRTQPGVS